MPLSDRIFHKDYDRKGDCGRKPQGTWRQDKLIGGKPPVRE
jgi:hypothetical protein